MIWNYRIRTVANGAMTRNIPVVTVVNVRVDTTLRLLDSEMTLNYTWEGQQDFTIWLIDWASRLIRGPKMSNETPRISQLVGRECITHSTSQQWHMKQPAKICWRVGNDINLAMCLNETPQHDVKLPWKVWNDYKRQYNDAATSGITLNYHALKSPFWFGASHGCKVCNDDKPAALHLTTKSDCGKSSTGQVT